MSIQSEINRIEQNIANAYSTLSARGATLPAEQNSENLANTISEIGGADWNQNDPTHPDYIENRTHFCSDPIEATFSGPYTWEEGSGLYEKGMVCCVVVGTVYTDVPINICDISGVFGASYTNVLMGQVISNTSGPSFEFCWYASYTGTGYEIQLHSNTTAGMYGATPTMNNFRAVTKLPEAYLPDAVNAHIANKNNPHGVTAEQIGAASKEYVDNAVANAGGGSGVHIGADEPEDGDVWIDTDDEGEDSSDNFIPNGGGNVYGDYTMQGNVNMMGYLQIDSPSQYGSLRTEGSMLAFTGSDGATIYVGGNGNIGDYEIVQNGVPTLTILDNNDEPVRINGVLAPVWDYEAANKQYVDSKIAYGTDEVEAGSASPYPEGTLYVVIE